MKKYFKVIVICVAMLSPMVCQAFTFTDIVAKLQRADEYTKNKLRWASQKADRSFQNEKLVSMVLLAQHSYEAYQSVNRAIDEIQAFVLNPTITVYNQNGDGFSYGIRGHELSVWEREMTLAEAKLNKNPLYQESPDYQKLFATVKTSAGEDYNQQISYKKWLDGLRKEMDERKKSIDALLANNHGAVTGQGNVNASYQRAILIRLQVEQTQILLEMANMLYNKLADDFKGNTVAGEYGRALQDLTPSGASEHNMKVIEKLFSEDTN